MSKIQCPTCEGKGEVPMPYWAAETMALFKTDVRRDSENVRLRISDAISRNGVNNRLERLRGLGLLERTRQGKWWFYFRPAKSK